MSCCETIEGGSSVGDDQSWAQTLVVGNISGGTDPTITNGDQIIWVDGASIIKGLYDATRTATAVVGPTTAFSYTLVDNSALLLKARVVAMQTDGSNRKMFEVNVGVFRDGGIATVQGVAFDSFVPFGTAGFAAVACTWDVDGANAVRLRVTGLAGVDITWSAQIFLTESR